MIVETEIGKIRDWTNGHRFSGASIGVVPTMGALHEGHLSLFRRSIQVCDQTAATIFVNPTQFAAGEDLDQYPRTLESDLDQLEKAGVDAVFTPAAAAMYPADFSTSLVPPEVARTLEGECRPSHFQGVATVVLKLFHIIPATHAFFGQKDFQQAAVIQAMTRDLNLDVLVEVCPIVRDPDGLAMSSRNRYLSRQERARALNIHAALQEAKQAFESGNRESAMIESMMRQVLADAVDAIEYAVVVDSRTFVRIPRIDRPAVALVAARVGGTRLIDNMLLA